ncbi:hypothetical protein ACKFKF_33560 [Phormidesmis sp. 146-12]
MPYIYRSHAKSGTTSFFAYATVYVIARNKRVIVNLWIYLLWCFVSHRGSGVRRVYRDRFPLKTMLEFLVQAVEQRFPVRRTIFLPLTI